MYDLHWLGTWWHQSITKTNADVLSIGSLGTNSGKFKLKYINFLYKMHLKMLSAKCRPFCPRTNEFSNTYSLLISLKRPSHVFFLMTSNTYPLPTSICKETNNKQWGSIYVLITNDNWHFWHSEWKFENFSLKKCMYIFLVTITASIIFWDIEAIECYNTCCGVYMVSVWYCIEDKPWTAKLQRLAKTVASQVTKIG